MCLSDRLGYRGGAERQLSGLTYFLKQEGYDVTAVTYLKQSHPSPLELNYGMNYTCLDASNIISKLFKVGKYIKKNKIDVVIAYKNGPTMLCCLLKLLGLKFKLIASERSSTHEKNRERLKFFLYRFSDVIVPNSYAQSRFIIIQYPNLAHKVKTIVNFVDVNKFSPNGSSRVSNCKGVIVGSIKEAKNPLNLIRAIKIMKDRNLVFHIDWIGTVNDEGLYEKCVRLVDELEVSDYICLKPATIDIHLEYLKYSFFCLPSIYEGFPNTLCEAMSCGLAVIASDVCDNPYILEQGKYGRLFNPNNPEMIADALSDMIRLSNNDLEELGLKNRSRIIELCSSKSFVKNYMELI